MKANEVRLLNLLQGPRQFTIPIYQRPYSWTVDDCAKLFNDILQVGGDANRLSYFMGSVVYYQPSSHAIGTVPTSLVIDGQQRLTTVILLLTAVARFLEANNEPIPEATSSRRIRTYYLTNELEYGELAQRLLLTKKDKETLVAVINGNPLPVLDSERVRENFDFFSERVNTNNVAALWAGISKLMVVGVSLEVGIDNPQLIFESLNSTGRPLDQSDLIRNYVLMQNPDLQDALYERYWYPMEAAFGNDYGWLFSEFMRDFLTMKLSRLVGIHTVYQIFKNEYVGGHTNAAQVEQLADELYQHAKYYVRLRRPELEENQELKAALEQLSQFGVTVAYPYLIDAYAASVRGELTKAELAEVVRMVERYVVRRAICGVPTNTLNSTFATFGRELDAANYLESVKSAFLELSYNRRFPLDEEFKERLIDRDTYHTSRTRNYLLHHLENYKRKEYVDISEYTIEHIMPQSENVSEAWQQELGPDWEIVHRRLLHTLGNLTLTGYNSELSNRPFAEKKIMLGGFQGSPIQLNKSVTTEPVWNEAAILRRAELLADWAIAIWPAPQVAEPVAMVEEEVDEQAVEAALEEAGLVTEQE
jgi:uncharacterized protein with ParB-like and HNH nuclease domain